jgi:ArsR family transcriptional regulator
MRKYSLKEIDRIISALSEVKRLRIVAVLNFRPLAVCEIREILGLSFSTVSRHLSLLKEARLIVSEKEGKWVHHRMNPELDAEIQELLQNLLNLISDDNQIREDLEKARIVDKNIICQISASSGENKTEPRRFQP